MKEENKKVPKQNPSDAEMELELQDPSEVKPTSFVLAGQLDEIRVPVHTAMLLNGGSTKTIKWAITVKRCTVPEHDAYMKAVSDGAMTDFDVAREVMVGWHMLKTVDGEKVPFNEPNLMGVFLVPEYKKSITSAIYDVMSGGARKKMFK